MTDKFSGFTTTIAGQYGHVFAMENKYLPPITVSFCGENYKTTAHLTIEQAEKLADLIMEALDWVREAPARQYAAEQAETAACEQQERGSPERGEFDARTEMVPKFLTQEAI